MSQPVTKENLLVTSTVTNEDLLRKLDSMHNLILDTQVKKEARDASTQSSATRLSCQSHFFCNCSPHGNTKEASTQTNFQEPTTSTPTSVNSASKKEDSSRNPKLEEKYQELNKKIDKLRSDICDPEKINQIQTYLLT